MKILVGILYCIENEFDECIAAIEQQTHQDYEYFVLRDLPNKEAHDMLYKTFMQRAKEFDLFMKVDADMVLVRSTFFEEIATKFRNDSEMDFLAVSVDDYFTNQPVLGLNIYRNTVRWPITRENIFVDRNAIYKNPYIDNTELAPAAYHCPNPSKFQAYHFGLHKAVKLRQHGNKDNTFHSYLMATYNNFKVKNELLLGFAIIGAIVALENGFGHQEVDYANKNTLAHFATIESYSIKEIQRAIRKRRYNVVNYISLGVGNYEQKFIRKAIKYTDKFRQFF